MTENKVPLGKLIEREECRDAIHIAVAPVTAGTMLRPGEHVVVKDGVAYSGSSPVGVVDPFLRDIVPSGARCWLLLYPYTITSLRHEWLHPAFNGPGAPVSDQHAASEAWLRAFALQWNMRYDDMIHGARERSDWHGITAMHTDIHSWSELDAGEAEEFWQHLEVVTGESFDSAHRENTYFSCSC